MILFVTLLVNIPPATSNFCELGKKAPAYLVKRCKHLIFVVEENVRRRATIAHSRMRSDFAALQRWTVFRRRAEERELGGAGKAVWPNKPPLQLQ